MKFNKKGGFTLIEAVICIGLITLIAAAFLSMAVTNLSITKQMNGYAGDTSALVSAYETNIRPSEVKRRTLSSASIETGGENHGEFILRRAELYIDGQDSGMTYYYYG